MIEIERYKMNIIVVLFHSFIHFCLNDHFLSAGADIRKCWALNKCSLSEQDPVSECSPFGEVLLPKTSMLLWPVLLLFLFFFFFFILL